ncbi:MAG: AtaL-like protein, partial [Pseudomonadota bacterium]|nr:AtaL-like protein [Pseudomonadota bacterium]
LRGEETQELVTFQPERRITFERTKGNVMGTILNETTEPKNGELGLRYMFSLVPSTLENGGAEEAKFAKHISESCVRGVHSTLVEIRRRVAIGEIDAPQKRTLHDDRT